MGLTELRQALAAYLRDSRGVECDWRQVAITSGSRQALYILGQLLLDAGDRVLVEDPGYPGARNPWLQRGATLEPAPVDEQGLVPPETIGGIKPNIIYCTPSRQFPTGACLPVSRRLAWLDFARRTSAWLVEDDYDSEYRYSRPPIPSLHSLDSAGRVIYVIRRLTTTSRRARPRCASGSQSCARPFAHNGERRTIWADKIRGCQRDGMAACGTVSLARATIRFETGCSSGGCWQRCQNS